MMKLLFSLSFLLPFAQSVAQFTVDEDTLQNSNILSTDLQNDVTNASLNSRLSYKAEFEKYTFTLSNIFNSDITKLSSNFIRDKEQLEFSVRYKLSDKLSVGPGAGLRSLSDDRSVELNRNYSNFIFADVLYEPIRNFKINSKFGFLRDEQIGESNSGVKFLINAEYPDFFIDDYSLSSIVDINYEDLSVKKNYNVGFVSDLFKSFSGYADNLGSIRAYMNKIDLFFPASADVQKSYGIKSNIETRAENMVELEDKLRYLIHENILLNVSGGLLLRSSKREIRFKTFSNTLNFDRNYDASVSEIGIKFSGEMQNELGMFLNKIKLQFIEKDETHKPVNLNGFTPAQVREIEKIERNKNYSNLLTTLSAETNIRLSDLHGISVTGSASIFRYDTKSDENFDDRDEQFLIGEIKHRYSNLRNFSIETAFSVNRASLKYLFAERSSNNNINTIYKLSVNSVFKPFEALVSRSSFQISANYTVYDFEDILSQVQSFSYRQLILRDSVDFTLSPAIIFKVFGEFRLSEQGEFNDLEFSLKPLTLFDDRFIRADINVKIFGEAEAYLGYRFYQQMRYNYNLGVKELSNTFRNYGPIGGIKIPAINRTLINFQGGLEILRFDNSLMNTESTFFSINIFWEI